MIIKNIDIKKLHDEFNKKDIFPDPILMVSEGVWDFTFKEDTDMVLVQQIIDLHDNTPTPTPLTEIELLKISQAEQFETILEILGGM